MFSVLVKIEGMERRKKSAAVLHTVTGFFLILKSSDFYRYENNEDFSRVVPFLIVAFISILYGILRKRIDPDAQVNYWLRLLQVLTFTILGIFMIRSGHNSDAAFLLVWAAISVLLLFTEKKIFTETDLLFHEKGITIPGLYGKHLVRWHNLSSVVVRQDYITIIHKDNKYLQYAVLQNLSDLEVAKMNSFSRDHIESVAMKVQNN